MKHLLPHDSAKPLIEHKAATTPAMTLHLIERIGEDGKPGLAGCGDIAVLCPGTFTNEAVGGFAVCIGISDTTLMVLGHLPIEAMATALASTGRMTGEQPVTFKCGRSQLQLHPDGRIRITGDDVIIESNGRMGLRGAIIDLN